MKKEVIKFLNHIAIITAVGIIDATILLCIEKAGFIDWLWKCVVELALLDVVVNSGEQAFTIILNASAGLIAGMAILWGLIYAIPQLTTHVLTVTDNNTEGENC